jgi:hypothetical protein
VAIWIVLAGRRFAAKSPGYGGWISLDFLGFSRADLDLSMGYTAQTRKSSLGALSPGIRRAGMGPGGLGLKMSGIAHMERLPLFLILCNDLSLLPLGSLSPPS